MKSPAQKTLLPNVLSNKVRNSIKLQFVNLPHPRTIKFGNEIEHDTGIFGRSRTIINVIITDHNYLFCEKFLHLRINR